MRKILRAEGSEIRLRMWLYPWLTWLVIGFITFVLVVMLFRPAQQLEADFHRLISDRDYLYRADYGALEKAGIVAKNARFIIRADHDQESHHDHYVSLDGYRWLKNDIIRGNFVENRMKNYESVC